MAETSGRGSSRPADTDRSATVASDPALKRTLERNTAVQGERAEEPAGVESIPPTARPMPGTRGNTSK